MPWSIHERDGKFCVVKDADGSVVHCHETREKALAQQRALYANEPSATASLELDTSALMEEFYVESEQPPVRIEVGPAPDRAVEAIVSSLNVMAQRLLDSEERQAELVAIVQQLSTLVNRDQETLLASMQAMTEAITEAVSQRQEIAFPEIPEPIVNVTVPEPVVNVQPPQVHVTVEAPESKKKVIVERDPLTGLISSAQVEEVNEP